ncbi:MAG: hypothetical protein EOO44_17905 [Flavobacterium sp.]|nr:MAG: hypothetical protein EOO44_17905 [Flavobacterium sp.]
MADFFEKKDRHLIPNWRSFENTAKLGELNGSKSIKLDSSFKPDISDLLDGWNDSQSIGIAGDILGTALVCNQEENEIVKKISHFVLQNKHTATNAIIDAANTILVPKREEIQLNSDISNPNEFGEKTNLLEIHIKINDFKNKLINSPHNAILWVEIARLYSILGQDRRAEKALINALYLAPENRFILRSISRFYVHIGNFDFAHDIIRKSNLTKLDPWLMATEIALATLRNRNSLFTKKGIQLVNSNNFHPFNISELASSVASVELKNASVLNSKKLFKQSLISPNDNSLAQAEWASQEDRSLMNVDPNKFNLINSFEASARDFFDEGNWQESIHQSKKWFFDQPFSKLGVLFGNEVASRKLRDNNQAFEIAKLGLISHPHDPHLLNNIIYALSLQNKLDEAESYLRKVKKEDLNSREYAGICLTATKGLLYFRKGLYDLGRKYYANAIKIANEEKISYLSSLAYVNYIREEILIGQNVKEMMPTIDKILKSNIGKDIAEDAKEVIELYKKNNPL